MNQTFIYDIFAGKSRPGRNNAIRLAFGLGCDLRETQRLLRLAGVSELYCKQRRDAIIIWCIQNGRDLPLPTMNCIGWARIPWCRRTSAGR